MSERQLAQEYMKEHGSEFTRETKLGEFSEKLYAYMQEKNPVSYPDFNVARYSAVMTEWAKLNLTFALETAARKLRGL